EAFGLCETTRYQLSDRLADVAAWGTSRPSIAVGHGDCGSPFHADLATPAQSGRLCSRLIRRKSHESGQSSRAGPRVLRGKGLANRQSGERVWFWGERPAAAVSRPARRYEHQPYRRGAQGSLFALWGDIYPDAAQDAGARIGDRQ